MEYLPPTDRWEVQAQEEANLLRAEVAQLMHSVPTRGYELKSYGCSAVSLNNNLLKSFPKRNRQVLVRSAGEVEVAGGELQDGDPTDIQIVTNDYMGMSETNDAAEHLIVSRDYRLNDYQARLDIGTLFLDKENRILPESYGLLLSRDGDNKIEIAHKYLNENDPDRKLKALMWVLSPGSYRHSIYVCQEMLGIVHEVKGA